MGAAHYLTLTPPLTHYRQARVARFIASAGSAVRIGGSTFRSDRNVSVR